MPIDNSIYFRQQLPDIAGSIQSGMKLGDMFRQRKQDQAVEDAYRNNINEKGEFSSQGRLLSDLTRAGAYKEAAAQKEAFGADAAAKLKAQRDRTDRLYQIASSAKDQNSYTSALKMAAAEGLDISQMPQQYDPGLMSQYERALLTAKERAQFDFDRTKAAQDQRNKEEDQRIARMKAGAEKTTAETKSKGGESLPLDAKKTVETLATKNANKISIKNQIDAALAQWDNLSDDQKVTTGRQLLKTLNSTEGADAIGVEEANRLGSKLEVAFGNFTNSNPTQFGRDLPGFKEQAQNVSRSIGTAVRANQKAIDSAMGRTPEDQASVDAQAVAWALQNPRDPRAVLIIQKNQSAMGSR